MSDADIIYSLSIDSGNLNNDIKRTSKLFADVQRQLTKIGNLGAAELKRLNEQVENLNKGVDLSDLVNTLRGNLPKLVTRLTQNFELFNESLPSKSLKELEDALKIARTAFKNFDDSVDNASVKEFTTEMRILEKEVDSVKGALSLAQNTLKQLERYAKDTDNIKDLARDIASIRTAIDQLNRADSSTVARLDNAFSKLPGSIDSTEQALTQLNIELDEANRRYTQLSNSIRSNNIKTDSIEDLRARLSGVRTQLESLKRNDPNFNRLARDSSLLANELRKAEQQADKFNKTVKTGQGIFTSFGRSFRLFFQGFVAFEALQTARRSLIGSIEVGRDFEQQIQNVSVILNSTNEQTRILSDTARDLGIETQFTATQVAEAQEQLAIAGLKFNEILDAQVKVLQLAVAGQVDLAQAANIVSSIFRGSQDVLAQSRDEFGAYLNQAEQLQRVNEVLVRSFTSFNVTLDSAFESFKLVGPIANVNNQVFEETAALIDVLGNAGIRGSIAGTQLRGAFAQLLKPTEDAQKILANLAQTLDKDLQTLLFDSSGNLRSLIDIIEDLEKAGISSSQILQVFGRRAGTAISALVNRVEELRVATDLVGTLGSNFNGVIQTIGGIDNESLPFEAFRDGIKTITEGSTNLQETSPEIAAALGAIASVFNETDQDIRENVNGIEQNTQAFIDNATKLGSALATEIQRTGAITERSLNNLRNQFVQTGDQNVVQAIDQLLFQAEKRFREFEKESIEATGNVPNTLASDLAAARGEINLGLQFILDDIENFSSSADQQARRLETFKGAVTQLSSSIQELQIGLFAAVEEDLLGVITEQFLGFEGGLLRLVQRIGSIVRSLTTEVEYELQVTPGLSTPSQQKQFTSTLEDQVTKLLIDDPEAFRVPIFAEANLTPAEIIKLKDGIKEAGEEISNLDRLLGFLRTRTISVFGIFNVQIQTIITTIRSATAAWVTFTAVSRIQAMISSVGNLREAMLLLFRNIRTFVRTNPIALIASALVGIGVILNDLVFKVNAVQKAFKLVADGVAGIGVRLNNELQTASVLISRISDNTRDLADREKDLDTLNKQYGVLIGRQFELEEVTQDSIETLGKIREAIAKKLKLELTSQLQQQELNKLILLELELQNELNSSRSTFGRITQGILSSIRSGNFDNLFTPSGLATARVEELSGQIKEQQQVINEIPNAVEASFNSILKVAETTTVAANTLKNTLVNDGNEDDNKAIDPGLETREKARAVRERQILERRLQRFRDQAAKERRLRAAINEQLIEEERENEIRRFLAREEVVELLAKGEENVVDILISKINRERNEDLEKLRKSQADALQEAVNSRIKIQNDLIEFEIKEATTGFQEVLAELQVQFSNRLISEREFQEKVGEEREKLNARIREIEAKTVNAFANTTEFQLKREQQTYENNLQALEEQFIRRRESLQRNLDDETNIRQNYIQEVQSLTARLTAGEITQAVFDERQAQLKENLDRELTDREEFNSKLLQEQINFNNKIFDLQAKNINNQAKLITDTINVDDPEIQIALDDIENRFKREFDGLILTGTATLQRQVESLRNAGATEQQVLEEINLFRRRQIDLQNNYFKEQLDLRKQFAKNQEQIYLLEINEINRRFALENQLNDQLLRDGAITLQEFLTQRNNLIEEAQTNLGKFSQSGLNDINSILNSTEIVNDLTNIQDRLVLFSNELAAIDIADGLNFKGFNESITNEILQFGKTIQIGLNELDDAGPQYEEKAEQLVLKLKRGLQSIEDFVNEDFLTEIGDVLNQIEITQDPAELAILKERLAELEVRIPVEVSFPQLNIRGIIDRTQEQINEIQNSITDPQLISQERLKILINANQEIIDTNQDSIERARQLIRTSNNLTDIQKSQLEKAISEIITLNSELSTGIQRARLQLIQDQNETVSDLFKNLSVTSKAELEELNTNQLTILNQALRSSSTNIEDFIEQQGQLLNDSQQTQLTNAFDLIKTLTQREQEQVGQVIEESLGVLNSELKANINDFSESIRNNFGLLFDEETLDFGTGLQARINQINNVYDKAIEESRTLQLSTEELNKREEELNQSRVKRLNELGEQLSDQYNQAINDINERITEADRDSRNKFINENVNRFLEGELGRRGFRDRNRFGQQISEVNSLTNAIQGASEKIAEAKRAKLQFSGINTEKARDQVDNLNSQIIEFETTISDSQTALANLFVKIQEDFFKVISSVLSQSVKNILNVINQDLERKKQAAEAEIALVERIRDARLKALADEKKERLDNIRNLELTEEEKQVLQEREEQRAQQLADAENSRRNFQIEEEKRRLAELEQRQNQFAAATALASSIVSQADLIATVVNLANKVILASSALGPFAIPSFIAAITLGIGSLIGTITGAIGQVKTIFAPVSQLGSQLPVAGTGGHVEELLTDFLKQQKQVYGTGGKIGGHYHDSKKGGTIILAEKDEFILNRAAYAMNKSLVHYLNDQGLRKMKGYKYDKNIPQNLMNGFASPRYFPNSPIIKTFGKAQTGGVVSGSSDDIDRIVNSLDKVNNSINQVKQAVDQNKTAIKALEVNYNVSKVDAVEKKRDISVKIGSF